MNVSLQGTCTHHMTQEISAALRLAEQEAKRDFSGDLGQKSGQAAQAHQGSTTHRASSTMVIPKEEGPRWSLPSGSSFVTAPSPATPAPVASSSSSWSTDNSCGGTTYTETDTKRSDRNDVSIAAGKGRGDSSRTAIPWQQQHQLQQREKQRLQVGKRAGKKGRGGHKAVTTAISSF